jgi:hypothetical protein
MSNATYEVIIKDPSTSDIWEVIPKSYNFTETLNREAKATFNFSFEELEKMAEANETTVINVLTAALREIYINRNGSKIFYGVITDFDVEPDGQGGKNLSIKAMGFFGLFKKRLVGIGTEVYYAATDAGAIAADLIADSQASDGTYSDWGITAGSITASKNRDRGYLFDNIYDSIIKLSNDNLEDGFDFDIDVTKQFNVYYPIRGQARPNVVFDQYTMAGWHYSKQIFSGMVNKVYAIGEGFNDVILYETRLAAVGYRSPFGTLEEKLEAREVTEVATLQDKGDRRLLEAREPKITLSDITHYDDGIKLTDYNVGDSIVVNLPELGLANTSKRVIERTFTMATPKSIAECKLKLE